MESTLLKIQKLMNLGRILSKIIKIFSKIGAICCVLGMLALYVVENYTAYNLQSMIEQSANVTMATIYAVLVIGFISCLGEAILTSKAQTYFENEIEDGTPFTLSGANELKTLGIWTIVLPIVVIVIDSIIYALIENIFGIVKDMDLSNEASVSIGIAMLLFSLVFRYVAEKETL